MSSEIYHLTDEILFSGEIVGELASKANQRRAFRHPKTGRPIFVKSEKALRFVRAAEEQLPILDPLLEGDLGIVVQVWYATRRPDLDEALLLDCLQGRLYKNDRQIRAKLVQGGVDRVRPRTEFALFRAVARGDLGRSP